MLEIYYFDKKIKKGTIKDLPKIKSKNIWVDAENITKEEADLLGKTFGLHPLTSEDLLNTPVATKIEEFPEYLFCVFYGVQNSFEPVEVDFVLGKNFLITCHKPATEAAKKLKSQEQKIEQLLKQGPDYLFHKILDMEVDNYSPILIKLDSLIENLEEKVAKKPESKLLNEILKLKRKIVRLKRFAYPLREKLLFITKDDHRFISKKLKPYFRDVYDHAVRVSEKMDTNREAIGNAFDVYMSALSNNMNEVMKVLSMIATLALPLGVISGIYGTNFANLPGQGYFYGFWAMLAVMFIMILTMLFFFRKRGWF